MKYARIAALALAGVPLAAAPSGVSIQPAGLQATFIGNAAVAISDGRTTVVSDFPYESGAFGYMTYARDAVTLAGDVVLMISHAHADHWLGTAQRPPSWRVVGPANVTAALPSESVLPPGSASPSPDVRIVPLETSHAGIEHYSYRVEWGDLRLHFTGDTEDAATLIAERDLDVAFVTPWLLREVLRRGARVPAARVVVYHHTAAERVPECDGPCRLPRQGDRWTIVK
jgi:L-ascorbate metabolism protein UlaG (beta-lactamase superfamily)